MLGGHSVQKFRIIGLAFVLTLLAYIWPMNQLHHTKIGVYRTNLLAKLVHQHYQLMGKELAAFHVPIA